MRSTSTVVVQQPLPSRLKIKSPPATMKNLIITIILVFAVAFGCGQTIELGYPTDGTVLKRGKNFTAEVILPVSGTYETQLGSYLLLSDFDGFLHSSWHSSGNEPLLGSVSTA